MSGLVAKRDPADVPGLGEVMSRAAREFAAFAFGVPRVRAFVSAGAWARRASCRGRSSLAERSRRDPSSVPCLGRPRNFLAARPGIGGSRLRPVSSSAAIQRSAQNWHGPGESDCLIKTKHCDGPSGC